MRLVSLCVMMLLAGVAAVVAAPTADRITSLPGYPALSSATYGGYLNATSTRKAYYMFLESTGNPSSDPVVLWLTGGPGCSSLLGLFEENGPVLGRLNGTFEANPYAWNQMANVLYIESPAGVGFSIDTTPPTVFNDKLTAEYNFAALQSFFVEFPEFAKNKLFLTGESYAGFYVPELAYQILQSNDQGMKSRMQGFMVGNPCTGEYGCENPDPFLNPYLQYNGFAPLTAGMNVDVNANYNPYDLLVPTCAAGSTTLRARFVNHPVLRAYRSRIGRNPDDVGTSGPVPPYGPCAINYLTAWLNRPDVQAALHAKVGTQWVPCGGPAYTLNLDGVVPLYREMFDQTNWSILIYSGLDDSIVNQAQTQTIVNNFGRPLAGTQQFQAWYRPDVYNASQTQLSGFFVQYDRVAWAGVRDAGHQVPMFNPPAALELFRSFLTIGTAGRLTD